jgi:hypothetical protein
MELIGFQLTEYDIFHLYTKEVNRAMIVKLNNDYLMWKNNSNKNNMKRILFCISKLRLNCLNIYTNINKLFYSENPNYNPIYYSIWTIFRSMKLDSLQIYYIDGFNYFVGTKNSKKNLNKWKDNLYKRHIGIYKEKLNYIKISNDIISLVLKYININPNKFKIDTFIHKD